MLVPISRYAVIVSRGWRVVPAWRSVVVIPSPTPTIPVIQTVHDDGPRNRADRRTAEYALPIITPRESKKDQREYNKEKKRPETYLPIGHMKLLPPISRGG